MSPLILRPEQCHTRCSALEKAATGAFAEISKSPLPVRVVNTCMEVHLKHATEIPHRDACCYVIIIKEDLPNTGINPREDVEVIGILRRKSVRQYFDSLMIHARLSQHDTRNLLVTCT